MFKVEMIIDGEWQDASSHTLLVDAEIQKQRFIDAGRAAENSIRITTVEQ